MALPNKVLPGFVASLYMQPGASPTAVTPANLSVLATIAAIAVSANELEVQTIPLFGQEDAVASFMAAGRRQSDKIPVQSAPASMTLTAAWNPSNANILLIRGDAISGLIDRTFVIAASASAADIVYFAFIGRVSQFTVDPAPGAEAQCTFTIHPRGNQYAWSNTA
jgi:hypothetical protein